MVGSIESWDLFAPARRLDVLRGVVLLARQLSEIERYKVRLFVDDLSALTAMNSRIDPGLWLQPVDGIELARLTLAGSVMPADNIVRLFGARIPIRYVERTIQGHDRRRKLFKVRLLDDYGRIRKDVSCASPSNLLVIDAAQGDFKSDAGMIREQRSLVTMRSRWREKIALRRSTADALGLGDLWACDSILIFCCGVNVGDWDKVLVSLGGGSRRPVVVLVEPGQDVQHIQAAANKLDGAIATTGVKPVRVIVAPSMTWSQLDEVVWMSDFVLTGSHDMAQRAIESGVPLLWVPGCPNSDAGVGGRLIDWYLRDSDPVIGRCLRFATQAIASGVCSSGALREYFNNQDGLEVLAKNVSQRVANAPLLSLRLSGLVATLPRTKVYDTSSVHVPTMPMTLPG